MALNELISMYGVPAGWDVSRGLYEELWGHLPGDVLRDAVRAHMTDPDESRWFPKPGQVLAHARDEMDARYAARRRERYPERLEAPQRPRMTEDEMEELLVKYGWREPRAAAGRIEVKPLYVIDEVPETVAGEPWRE